MKIENERVLVRMRPSTRYILWRVKLDNDLKTLDHAIVYLSEKKK